MKILLILPNPYPGFVATRSLGKRPNTPPLNLPYLAALTPANIDVEIIDETVEEIDFEKQADMVGISVLTMAATRAYQIAAEFRKRGVTVVLGGIHPTLLPEEAGSHADSIVIGEAEDIWQQLLRDFRNRRLKKQYQRKERPSLENLPTPRWELIKRSKYLTTNVVQVSRGCPYNCKFCSIWLTFGRKPRYRPIPDIINEIEKIRGKLIGFTDADIVGNPNYAAKLFEALAPYKKYWVSDAGIRITQNEPLLKGAAKSGCKILYIGIEVLSDATLRESGKLQNLRIHYKEAIKRLHQHGIMLGAGFIFGFDNEDKSIFERTVEFAIDCKIDMADFHVLCPYPGTQIYKQLKDENRIFESDWSKFSKYNVVYYPKQMSPEELLEGCYWAWKEFYAAQSVFQRFMTPHVFKSWINPFAHLAINFTLNREAAHYDEVLNSKKEMAKNAPEGVAFDTSLQ